MVYFGLGLFLSNQDIYYFSENNPANKIMVLSSMNIDTIKCFYLRKIISMFILQQNILQNRLFS